MRDFPLTGCMFQPRDMQYESYRRPFSVQSEELPFLVIPSLLVPFTSIIVSSYLSQGLIYFSLFTPHFTNPTPSPSFSFLSNSPFISASILTTFNVSLIALSSPSCPLLFHSSLIPPLLHSDYFLYPLPLLLNPCPVISTLLCPQLIL